MKNNRDYKQFFEGNFYHIYNRGNEKACIFKESEDFDVFLYFTKEALFPENTFPNKSNQRRTTLPPNSFSLGAYCLMPNHYHILIRQNKKIPISTFIRKVCTSYAKYFNKKYNRVGHLFQDAFKASHIKNQGELQWIVEYIHQNPVRAGLVFSPEDYRWSSFYRALKPLQLQWESL